MTLRELYWAAEAKQESEWGRWSVLLSMTYNVNRDPKRTSALGPEDFNPFSRKKGKGEDIEVPFEALKLLVTNPAKRE